MKNRFGTISIFIEPDKSSVAMINNLLTEHSDMILGRMGIPNPAKNINVICLIIYGDTDEIGSLTGKLGLLKGIQVKSCLYKSKQ
jgi:putative iron-only hydrogenase system regulator